MVKNLYVSERQYKIYPSCLRVLLAWDKYTRAQVALYQRPESEQFLIDKTVGLGIKRSERLQAAGWEEEKKEPHKL